MTEAIRGEGAPLLDQHGERFVDELAPRDEVARAVQHRIDASGGHSVGLDMRHVDPALFPNVVGALRRAGHRPRARADPGRSRRPLHDGRDRDRSGRPRDGRRPARGRRVLVHRPARRQPARVELAERMLRVRRPCGCGRRRPQRDGGPTGCNRAARAAAQAAAHRCLASGAVARRRTSTATRPACDACSTTHTRWSD